MYTQLQLRDSARPPVTVASLGRMKEQGEKISCITCYDASYAALVDAADLDVVLVGDSLGMVIQGHTATAPVTLADMVYHTAAVVLAVGAGAVDHEPAVFDAVKQILSGEWVAGQPAGGAAGEWCREAA